MINNVTLNGKEPAPDQRHAYDWTSDARPQLSLPKAQKEGANKRDHRHQTVDSPVNSLSSPIDGLLLFPNMTELKAFVLRQ
jgi:hypothetical protein